MDNLQPNLQEIDNRIKRLIISLDVFILSTQELIRKYAESNFTDQLATPSRQAFSKSVLKPAINLGLVRMEHPDKPNSKNQKYKLTDLGMRLLKSIYETSQTNEN